METEPASLKALEDGLVPGDMTDRDETTINGLSEGEGVPEKDIDEEAQPKRQATDVAWDWDKDPDNPYNWPTGRKWWQVAMISSFAFLA